LAAIDSSPHYDETTQKTMVDHLLAGERGSLGGPFNILFRTQSRTTSLLSCSKPSRVSDSTFQATKERFGEKGVVDIIGLSGWYTIVSMAPNVDRYPLASGAQSELKPLEHPIP
jgi:hypothetical protein